MIIAFLFFHRYFMNRHFQNILFWILRAQFVATFYKHRLENIGVLCFDRTVANLIFQLS